MPYKSPALVKQADGPEGPPNYRPTSEITQSCGACANYQAGTCTKFGQPVNANFVCDKFESNPIGPSDSTFGALSSPIGLEQNKPPASFGEGIGLSPEQAFKAGFLMRCIDENLTEEQIIDRINFGLTKQADVLSALTYPAGKLLGGAVNIATIAGLGIPAAVGAAGGAMAADLTGDRADPKSYSRQELIAEYNQLAEEAERKARAKRKALGLPEDVTWQTTEGGVNSEQPR